MRLDRTPKLLSARLLCVCFVVRLQPMPSFFVFYRFISSLPVGSRGR